MDTESFLINVLQRGISLWAEGDKLRFRASQAALTPEVREELIQHKADLIRLLGENRKHVISSFGQERLWFLDQLAPGNFVNNVTGAVRLTGRLSVEALTRAINEVVKRHEALRTTLATLEGRAIQVVAPELEMALPVIDLSQSSEAEREEQASRFAAEEAQHPFNLVEGPLVRTTLLQMGPEDYVLLVIMHHAVADGWSITLFIRELSTLYQCFTQGQPSPLPELPMQYGDYATWQHTRLRGEVLEKQLAYWQEQLDGAPTILELPTDRPRPPAQSFRGAPQPIVLPRALSEALKALSQREGVTPFMTLLAAFGALLYRYTGQDDILIGSPIANRNQPEAETLIGFFLNTLVLRTDLSGNPTFRELLSRVRGMALEAYSHQDFPFEMLIDRLQLERDLSRTSLCQVAISFQEASLPSDLDLSVTGLTLSPFETETLSLRYDLALVIVDAPEGLTGILQYNTDLFEPATIARMARYFQTLLEGIVSNPEKPIAELPLIGEAERRWLLVDWNEQQGGFSPDACFHRLFEEQVARTPQATAVVFDGQALTYAELNRQANYVAQHLRRLGVGPEVCVGLYLERSTDLIVGILGVLKAGGAYLPVDPHDPIDRVLSLLKESQTAIVLTQESLTPDGAFIRLQGLQDVSQDIVITSPRPQIKPLDVLPHPDRSLVDFKKYAERFSMGYLRRNVSISATRGCPYQCAYCHKIWPKTHSYRSAENIFAEVKYCYDRGYRTFSVMDDIFNLKRENSGEFFKLVIKNKLKIRIAFPSGVRGDILTPDFIDLMSEAGTIKMALALETASPRLQKFIGKNLKIEKLRENLHYICTNHPHIILDLFTMFGFPTETEEELGMTLDFIKSIHWLHFPYLNALKIWPGTNIYNLALDHGVPLKALVEDTQMQFHEVSDTLPYPKSVARQYQASFTKDYFLLPERLQAVLPYQRRILSREEIFAQYNGYLPGGLASYPEIMAYLGEDEEYFQEEVEPEYKSNGYLSFPASFSHNGHDTSSGPSEAYRILFIDLQYFSNHPHALYNVIESPIGLMYLQTYLQQQYGDRVQGKIVKAQIDFDSFDDLKRIVDGFQPDLIGVRTLSIYKDFFHHVLARLKLWRPDTPIISGGPYASSEYISIMADRDIELAVMGEGDFTLAELVGKILENGGKLPPEDVLHQIAGLAYVPAQQRASLAQTQLGRRVVLLDRLLDEIGPEPYPNPQPVNQPANLAYVLHTSGSTGKPKGVMIQHRSMINLAAELHRRIYAAQDDRPLQISMNAPVTFDSSIKQLVMLLYGHSLHVIPHDMRQDARAFVAYLEQNRLDVLDCVPSHFKLLMDAGLLDSPTTAPSVVLLGGEAIDAQTWQTLAEATGVTFYNVYGPTECTVNSSVGCLEAHDQRPTIGRPLGNIQLYVLDTHRQSVPIGVPGELYIGGAGVARGYLDRPDLTAERFVPNPFLKREEDSSFRLYKTGDLVRFMPAANGRSATGAPSQLSPVTLEFLGRVDHQVKVRGFRIELGEIEAALRQCDGVREAVVLAREDAPGDKRLVAYVTATDEQELSVSELRRFLKGKLPEYMLPSVFVMLDTLPRMPNGKLNRRALPAPEERRPDLETSYVAPRDEAERAIAAIWQEALQVDKVGVHDNFFDLGGHSFLVVQIKGKLEDLFQRDISVVELFQHTTVSALAQHLSQTQTTSPSLQSSYDRAEARRKSTRRQNRLQPQLSPEAELEKN